MFHSILLADIGTTTLVIGGVAAFLFVFFMFVAIWASRYTKVGPNQVLVISGRKHRISDPDGTIRDVGFRIVKGDRKSTRLNSSHMSISYAVFCLKKKKKKRYNNC